MSRLEDAADEIVEIIAHAIHTVFMRSDRWASAPEHIRRPFRREAAAARRALIDAGYLEDRNA